MQTNSKPIGNSRNSAVKTLNIGINGRFLASRLTGVERYASNVYKRLIPLAIGRGHSITVFVPEGYSADVEVINDRVRLIPSQIFPGAIGRHAWEQVVLPAMSTRAKVDVLLNMTNTAPCILKNNIVVIHDVSWLENPQWFSSAFNFGYNLVVPNVAAHALKIITVSSYSAAEIHKRLHAKTENIQVIPEGVGQEFKRVPLNEVPSSLSSVDLSRPYILHVGTMQPRKNLERLIDAYLKLFAESGTAPYLYLAGGTSEHFASGSVAEKLNCPGIKLLGYVSDDALPYLYSGAFAYVSASLYEGFGLTLLEAMACGAPVLASDISPHREVAGDSALFFEPTNPDSIFAALRTISSDSLKRAGLSQQGLEHVKKYSWENHVSELLNSIELTSECN